VAYALLGCLFACVLIARYFRPLVLGDAIGVEPANVERVEQRIDPNTAPWPELARLPEVGESMAKQIVAYREQHRPASRTGLVFRSLRDLEPIPGIGPKTLDEIAPYLKFPEGKRRSE